LLPVFSAAPKKETRLALAQGLSRLEPGAANEVGEVLCKLAGDSDPAVAREALFAVGNHLSPHACQAALVSLGQTALRGAGMRALVALGPPVIVPIANELSNNLEEPGIAAALTWSLGQIGTSRAVAPLVDALKAKHASTRLSASVALTNLVRCRPNIALPIDALKAAHLPEIEYYARLRDALLVDLPHTREGTVLRHSLWQRGQASLETLFRILSLTHAESSIHGAYQAIISKDRDQRQLALELLETLLEPKVRLALARAIGEAPSRSKKRDRKAILADLCEHGDEVLRALALLTLETLDPKSSPVAQGQHSMARLLVDQVLELQSVPLFSHASAEALTEIASVLGEREFKTGDVVYQECGPGDAMYLIRRGTVTLSCEGRTIEKLGPGDTFGIVAVLDSLPRELTATASTACSLMVLKAQDLHHLLAERPLLMHSVFRALTAVIRDASGRAALGKRTNT